MDYEVLIYYKNLKHKQMCLIYSFSIPFIL